MDFQQILNEIQQEVTTQSLEGKVASYIPELAKVSADKFGMFLVDKHCNIYGFGDCNERFSVQSITKVLSLSLAITLIGERVWERVDVEPSGDPFNSLVQLEYENGIPRNPLINAGALVIADILVSHLDDPKTAFLDFVQHISGLKGIGFNAKVAASEKAWGFRNAALVNFMKAFGNINNEVEPVLDFYFHMCALELSCKELAQTFILFANGGRRPMDQKQILTTSQTKRLNALMQTCGFYDEAGEFSFRVGLPGKSGVGGGIIAIHPGEYSVAVWSPPLNPKGNSTKGMKALELLTTKTGLSIF